MMSAQTLIKLTPENQVMFVNETHDIGVGTVVRLVPRDEVCVPESEYGRLYYVSVERGRFDAHRNDLGDLAAWEWEMERITNE